MSETRVAETKKNTEGCTLHESSALGQYIKERSRRVVVESR